MGEGKGTGQIGGGTGGDGKGRERAGGEGNAGKGKEGQGRAGKGRAGKGRQDPVPAPLTFLNSRKGTNWTMSRRTGSPLGERRTPSSPSRICMSVKSALPTPTMMMDMGR